MMDAAEVVVGILLRGIVAVDDTSDVITDEHLRFGVTFFLQFFHEGVGILQRDVTGKHYAEAATLFSAATGSGAAV